MFHTSIGGSGRQSLSRIAAYICEYSTFQITITKQYRVQEFQEDLKTLYRTTGIDYKATSFLFSDTQVSELEQWVWGNTSNHLLCLRLFPQHCMVTQILMERWDVLSISHPLFQSPLICDLYHFFNFFSFLCKEFSESVFVGVHIHNSFEYVSICCGMMISKFAL